MAFLLPVMAWSLRGLKMDNDVVGWLPKDDPQARVLTWYEEMFPSRDRILVSWDGATITDPRLRTLQISLEGHLREGSVREGGSPYVDDVTLPNELLARMLHRDIPFNTALQQIEGVLTGRGPLKLVISDAGRTRGEYLKQEILKLANDQFRLNAKFVDTAVPLPSLEGIDPGDSDALKVHDYLTEYLNEQPLYDLQLEWPGMHRNPEQLREFQDALLALEAPASGALTAGRTCISKCFFTSGSLAAVSVALSDTGVADKAAAVEAVRLAVEKAGVEPSAIHLGGQPVVNVAMNAAVQDAAWNPNFPAWDLLHRSPMILSAAVSVLFSFIMLKSFRLATLVQTVSFLTVVFTVALVPMTGSAMSMVLIVMPTLLAVLTTSAAIHLSNYWKHSGDPDPARSVISAAQTAWLPCALAAGTTAIGLASLLASNLVPVRDFGIFSAIGCVLSFLVVLYVLPSLMLYWPKSPPGPEELETAHWRRFGVWLARHRHAVCLACVTLTAAASWGLWQFRTETKVIRYFPPESRVVQDYVFLEDNLSGVISIDTIVKFDQGGQRELSFVERARKVQDLQQEIRNHPEISGVLSLASFLNLSDENTSPNRSRLMQKRVRDRLNDHEAEDNSVSSMLAVPEHAADWMTPGDQLLNHKGDEVWRITAQTSALSDTDLESLIADMNEIASRHLRTVGSPHTSHVVTGLTPVFLRTQQAVLESLIRSFGMAFLIIAVVMMVLLRSPVSGLITMLPNLMPVIAIFGVLSWMDLKIDIGTMITASVALGIAVDGTLHLLTWFRQLVKEGYSIEDAVGKALEHCGPAMWQTSAAIGFGMLALLPAELLLVSRFGWIMAALIFSALLADIVFLPALLGGTLGRLIQKGCQSEVLAAAGAAERELEGPEKEFDTQPDRSQHDKPTGKGHHRQPAAASTVAELKDVG
ncbi:MAG: MMPL family transporter [Planctomycetaceae bacterium]